MKTLLFILLIIGQIAFSGEHDKEYIDLGNGRRLYGNIKLVSEEVIDEQQTEQIERKVINDLNNIQIESADAGSISIVCRANCIDQQDESTRDSFTIIRYDDLFQSSGKFKNDRHFFYSLIKRKNLKFDVETEEKIASILEENNSSDIFNAIILIKDQSFLSPRIKKAVEKLVEKINFSNIETKKTGIAFNALETLLNQREFSASVISKSKELLFSGEALSHTKGLDFMAKIAMESPESVDQESLEFIRKLEQQSMRTIEKNIEAHTVLRERETLAKEYLVVNQELENKNKTQSLNDEEKKELEKLQVKERLLHKKLAELKKNKSLNSLSTAKGRLAKVQNILAYLD